MAPENKLISKIQHFTKNQKNNIKSKNAGEKYYKQNVKINKKKITKTHILSTNTCRKIV